MIDIDAAVRAMRGADPVPDPESLRRFMVDGAVFLDATRERTMEIQTEFDTVGTQKTPVPMWRRAGVMNSSWLRVMGHGSRI